MNSGSWVWKLALSLAFLGWACWRMVPVAPVAFEVYAPTRALSAKAKEFEELHKEALLRVSNQANAAVPEVKKSPSYYLSLIHI